MTHAGGEVSGHCICVERTVVTRDTGINEVCKVSIANVVGGEFFDEIEVLVKSSALVIASLCQVTVAAVEDDANLVAATATKHCFNFFTA